MHIGYSNPKYNYCKRDIPRSTVCKMNDLGISVDSTLSFNSYIDVVVGKAYRMCYHIINAFYTKSSVFMMSLFKTYVRPLLEYNCVIWSPSSLTSKSDFEGKIWTNFDLFVAQSNFSFNRISLKFWPKQQKVALACQYFIKVFSKS
jgi:hypothetical protein